MFKIIIVSVLLIVGCLFVFQQIDPNISATGGSGAALSAVDESLISVTIEGEIVVPGIYKMEPTQPLQELIDRAGGLTEAADTDSFNPETPIESHDYFYIPSKSSNQGTCEITTPVQKININEATATELATLNYISFALGEKIVQYREENGKFQTLEDVMKVSGIGRATYERIRDYITLK